MKLLIKPKVQKKQQKEERLMDNETGEIWYSDGDSLYQMVNGKKKYYNIEDYDCQDRLGVDKSKMSGDECDNLAQCILFNSERLPECLRNLSSYDMFSVAESEMSKMDPIIAGKLLQIFHVLEQKPRLDYKYGVKIVKPMSHKNWMINIVENNDHMPKGWTQDFKDTLKNNGQLLQYVKGLISFANKNPAILNQNMNLSQNNNDSDSDAGVESKILEDKHGIVLYVNPVEDTFERTAFDTAFIAQTIASDAFRPLPLLQSPFGNAVMGNGVFMRGGILNCMGGGSMMGGAERRADSAGELLIRYAKELMQTGVNFEPGTMDNLRNLAKQLRELESKCSEMNQVLVLLKRALSHAKCYDDNLDNKLSNRTLDLDEIMNNKDLVQFLGNSVSDYEVCLDKSFVKLNQGVETYVRYINELISSVSVGKKQIARKD
jgi:hypothetical protein